MTQRPPRAHRRLRLVIGLMLVVAVVGGSFGALAVATDTFGAGQRWQSLMARVDRFIRGPVPDRPSVATVRVTEPPATPAPTPTAVPSPSVDPAQGPNRPSQSIEPTASPTSAPTPTPEPVREPVDVRIAADPEAVFTTQMPDKDWCAPAGVQMVLSIHDALAAGKDNQKAIARRIGEWEARSDSLNGDWGPGAMALALDAYGVPGYEVRAFESRQGALRDAARTIQTTGAPVILLAWRGAHTWVMTGFRADADPSVFRDARIEGAYILDPWYPAVSTIWGASDPPGTFQDNAEMERNFLRWKRPEGKYPDRDGLFITVAPTVAMEPFLPLISAAA